MSERLVSFWASHGVLAEPVARRRLNEVVCVRLDRDEEIVGVNSVYADTAPLVDRKFWIYRRFLAPAADDEAELAMIKATREELAREFTGAPDEPVGLCMLVADPALMERYPQAVFPEAGLLFAGYTSKGVQVRIGYFDGARI